MRRLVLAELLLSLVMPRDRAASVAGDFAEASHGALSFALVVLRTWFGAISHQLSPGLFFRAAGAAILSMFVLRAAFGMLLVGGGRLLPGLVWMGPILAIASLFVLPIFAGYFVARLAPGCEIPAWVSLLALTAVGIVAFVVARPPQLWVGLIVPSPAGLLMMLLGVLAARRRYLRTA
jgi:hypothetical protein